MTSTDTKFPRDVYDAQLLSSNDRRADPSTRTGRSSVAGYGNGPGVGTSVTDERLFRQREQKANVSGVFEGTAGTSGDSKFITDVTEEDTPSAYEFFSGKSFKCINFADGFSVNKYLGEDERRTGFTSGADSPDEHAQLTRATTLKQLEVISKSRKRVDLETPVERVTRLQREVTEMSSFIQAFVDSHKIQLEEPSPNDSTPERLLHSHGIDEASRFFGAHPGSLLKELDVLRRFLDGVISSDAFKSPASDLAPQIPAGMSIEFVKAQLDAAETAIKKPPTETADTKERLPFTYELYTVPSAGDVVETSSILAAESRLAELEANLGISRGMHFSLPFNDVSSALKEIVSRLAVLHPSRLDGLSQRFQSIGTQIDELMHRKERLAAVKSIDGTGTMAEDQVISNLYEFCESSRPAAAALPTIVQRLKTLKVLHREAASMTSRLEALEAQQADLIKLVDSTQTHFDALNNSVQQNITWAKNIVEALEKKP